LAIALGLRKEESEFLGLGSDDGLANVNEEDIGEGEHAMALSIFQWLGWFEVSN